MAKVGIEMKNVSWKAENCLSCKWFKPSDPVNADILTNGRCIHPELLKFNLIVSGRDWCNLYEEISEKHIESMQDKALKEEEKENKEKYDL
jgi:hypothetical protein